MAEGIPACELLYDTTLLLQFCNGEWKRRCSPSSAVGRPAAPGSLERGPARVEEPPARGARIGLPGGGLRSLAEVGKARTGGLGEAGGNPGQRLPAPAAGRWGASPCRPSFRSPPRFSERPRGAGWVGGVTHAQNSELPQGSTTGREGQEGDPPSLLRPPVFSACSEGVCFSPTCQAGLGWCQPPGIIEGHLGINPAPSSQPWEVAQPAKGPGPDQEIILTQESPPPLTPPLQKHLWQTAASSTRPSHGWYSAWLQDQPLIGCGGSSREGMLRAGGGRGQQCQASGSNGQAGWALGPPLQKRWRKRRAAAEGCWSCC